jgi:mannose-6-phosphate isomerase
MIPITGYLQTYDWGVRGGLNPWLPSPAGEGPQAELWFGAHPNGPSPLRDEPGTLADATRPGEVSLLVKLLAAARPLSIQLHPPAELAAALFADGSDLVADDGAKIEMLVALEPFAVFAGWRDPEHAARLLEAADPDLVGAADDVRAERPQLALPKVLAVGPERVGVGISLVLEAASELGLDTYETASLALAAREFPGDPGLFVLLLLAHRRLEAGAAVYMPAGGVHAYAEGFGIEIMTSSDNVLRLGLTGKRIAVAEAIEALRDEGEPHFLGADVQMDHGHPVMTSYRPYSAPFAAEFLRSSSLVARTGGYRCVVCIAGETTIICGDEALTLQQGQGCAILTDEPDAHIEADGSAAVVETRG